MSLLRKLELRRRFEEAANLSELDIVPLDAPTDHPGRYRATLSGRSVVLRLYIWNVTPGGAHRHSEEYRIQPTGVRDSRFVQLEGELTLILGWWDESQLFCGFDFLYHMEPIGRSSSFQIRLPAMIQASADGLGVYSRGVGELAVAFRPELCGFYVQNLRTLHGCGTSESAIRLLNDTISESTSPSELVHDDRPGMEERRFAMISTRRALRDFSFRERVLTAYGRRCAMCSLQLNLVDAAHILPASHPTSSDDTANGVALCALHHRAFDSGLIMFDETFRVMTNERKVSDLRRARLFDGLDSFLAGLHSILRLPPDRRDRPAEHLINLALYVRRFR